MLALGNFDGLHRGHMKIIDRVRRRAGERGGTPAAMTFDPHPPRVVRPDKAPPLLMTTAQRLEALARAGMQGVAVVRFTHEMSQWDPETFVRTVLVEWLHVVEVWVGANFLFGHDRAGTFTRAARRSARATGSAPRRSIRSATRTSSSAARASAGWWRRPRRRGRRAARPPLLHRRHRGDKAPQRGRELGFPTANLRHRERAAAAGRRLCDDGGDRRRRASVGDEHRACVRRSATSIAGQVETHLLDVDRDLYGARIRLSFVQRLRDERAFPDVDALRAQIDADCRAARRLFGHISL